MKRRPHSKFLQIFRHFLNMFVFIEVCVFVFLFFVCYKLLAPTYNFQDQINRLNSSYVAVNLSINDIVASEEEVLDFEEVAVEQLGAEDNTKKKVFYEWVKEKPENWVLLEDISPVLLSAIVVSEDAKFAEHYGIDQEELQKVVHSYFLNLDGDPKKRKLRGASTITQQLVKNLFLSSKKRVSRKASEIAISLYVESKVPKWKILETYLNIIEYGKDLYGIKEASQHYFKKSPKNLTARESAFLAMLLPSPIRYSVSFRQRKLTNYATSTVNSILFKMLQEGYIGQDEYLQQLKERFDWELYDKEQNTSDDIGDL